MLLTSLYEFGTQLIQKGLVPKEGWVKLPVSFALGINKEGSLTQVLDLRTPVEVQQSKKAGKAGAAPKVIMTRPFFDIPFHGPRANGIVPYFLADNLKYLTGILPPEKGEDADAWRSKPLAPTFEATKELHLKVLDDLHTEKALAIKRFFGNWEQNQEQGKDVLAPFFGDELASGTLLFLFDWDGTFAQDDPDIAVAWDRYHEASQTTDDTVFGTCMVTGAKNVPIARLHPSFRGITGAQPTGTSLVSFNFPSACFREKSQGYNAPVWTRVTETYASALRYLLNDPHHHITSKNGKSDQYTHYVFWSKGDMDAEASTAFSMALFGRQDFNYDTEQDEALYHALKAYLYGSATAEHFSELAGALEQDFCIAVFRPHVARLACVGYYESSLDMLLQKLRQHHLDSAIDVMGTTTSYSLYDLIYGLTDSPSMTYIQTTLRDALFSAILYGTPYPPALRAHVIRAIESDQRVTPYRASVLYGYLRRNRHISLPKKGGDIMQEPSLQENQSFLQGQIFYLYQQLQIAALGREPNRTLKDMYFKTAATKPKQAFAILVPKVETYISRMGRGPEEWRRRKAKFYSMRLSELYCQLDYPMKSVTSQDEQSAFYLGYYTSMNDDIRMRKLRKEQDEQQHIQRKPQFDEEGDPIEQDMSEFADAPVL